MDNNENPNDSLLKSLQERLAALESRAESASKEELQSIAAKLHSLEQSFSNLPNSATVASLKEDFSKAIKSVSDELRQIGADLLESKRKQNRESKPAQQKKESSGGLTLLDDTDN